MSFEEVAAVSDGALLALGWLPQTGVHKGQRLLICGGSGSIGTAAVQLAAYFGAYVTAVCNTKNAEVVRALGAAEVIDYLHEDFTKIGHVYDVIFDAVGKHAYRRCRRSLAWGVYMPTDKWENLFWALLTARIGQRRVAVGVPPRYRKEDIVFLKGLVEAGHYQDVVDRCYPLHDMIEATTYVETEQKTGNVVLTIIPS
jgi:NADPH:quinone reductase-like Zn-dependent oxidoreductase